MLGMANGWQADSRPLPMKVKVNSNVKVVDLRIMNGLKLHDIQGGRSYRLGVHGASASSLNPQLSPRRRHLFSGQSMYRSGSNHPPVLRITGFSLPVSEYKPGYLSYGITLFPTKIYVPQKSYEYHRLRDGLFSKSKKNEKLSSQTRRKVTP